MAGDAKIDVRPWAVVATLAAVGVAIVVVVVRLLHPHDEARDLARQACAAPSSETGEQSGRALAARAAERDWRYEELATALTVRELGRPNDVALICANLDDAPDD